MQHARRSRDAESASERSERLTQGARKVTEEDMDMRGAKVSREADSAAEDGRKEDAMEPDAKDLRARLAACLCAPAIVVARCIRLLLPTSLE